MSLNRKLLIVLLVWALLGASNALAKSHQHGDHQQHQPTIVSPFDAGKEVRSLHCLLKGHTDRVFCPHLKTDRGQTASIATDCGGKASGPIFNAASFSNDFAEMSFFSLIHHSPNEKLTLTFLLAYHRFADSLDPPPRVL